MPHASAPSRFRWMLFGFLGIAGFFLLTEHRAHLFGALPFLFLLACPLLHWFGHGGHGGHSHRDSANPPWSNRKDSTPTLHDAGAHPEDFR